MGISYNKLFHLLIELNMKKGELQEKADITASIMARLRKNETVRTDTIGKICKALNCQPGDIMEYIETEEKTSKEIWEEQIELIKKPKKGILKESLKNGLAFGDTAAKELLEKIEK